MNKISIFLNYIFLSIISSFLVYALAIYYTQNVLLSLSFAGVWFVFFTMSFIFIKNKLQKKQKIAQDDRETYSNFKDNFLILSNSQTVDLLCHVKNTELLFWNEDVQWFKIENAICIFNFNTAMLYPDRFLDIFKAIDFTNETKVIIFSFEVSKDVQIICNTIKNLEVEIVPFEDVFNCLNDQELADDLNIRFDVEKAHFKDKIKTALSKQKALGYAFLGFFLLFFSFISPFQVYYQCFATLLIGFSVFVFFAKVGTTQ